MLLSTKWWPPFCNKLQRLFWAEERTTRGQNKKGRDCTVQHPLNSLSHAMRSPSLGGTSELQKSFFRNWYGVLHHPRLCNTPGHELPVWAAGVNGNDICCAIGNADHKSVLTFRSSHVLRDHWQNPNPDGPSAVDCFHCRFSNPACNHMLIQTTT